MNQPQEEPGGPLVGLCGGHRCTALWGMHASSRPDDAGEMPVPDALWSQRGPEALRQATVRSPGGVVLRLTCPGTCAEAPVVLLAALQHGSQTGAPLWVVSADRSGRLELVLRWLAGSWEQGMPAPPVLLRSALRRVSRVARPDQRSA